VREIGVSGYLVAGEQDIRIEEGRRRRGRENSRISNIE